MQVGVETYQVPGSFHGEQDICGGNEEICCTEQSIDNSIKSIRTVKDQTTGKLVAV